MKNTHLCLISLPLALAFLAPACGGGDEDASPNGDGDGDGDGDVIGDGDIVGDGDGDGDGDASGGGNMGGGNGDGDGDGDGDSLVSNPLNAECDISGVWAVVTKTKTRASGLDQVANRWFLYEFSHDGEQVIAARTTNCQVRVEDDDEIVGIAVTISDDGLTGVLQNSTDTGTTGTFKKNGDACDLDMARVYFVLGADSSFLPENPEERPELETLTPLPTAEDPEGAEDWDGDGDLGLAFNVASWVSGTRNSVQRAYQEFDSDSENEDYTIALDATAFTVNNLTAISESIISADDGLNAVGSLRGSDHPVTFTRLGDNRASAKLPSGDALPATDFEICKALEEEFPFSL